MEGEIIEWKFRHQDTLNNDFMDFLIPFDKDNLNVVDKTDLEQLGNAYKMQNGPQERIVIKVLDKYSESNEAYQAFLEAISKHSLV